MNITPRSFQRPLIFICSFLILSLVLQDVLKTVEADSSAQTTTSTIITVPIVPSTTFQIVEVSISQTILTTTTSLPVTTTTEPYIPLPNPCKYDNTHRYTVTDGDYLLKIADLYNTEVLDIVGCNQWPDEIDHLLLPGDKIIIPPDGFLDPVVTTTTAAPVSTTTPITQPPTPVTQPPSTTPASDPSGRVTHPDCWWEGAIRSAWAKAGASVATQDFFVYVAWRESKCQQTAHNGNRSTGDDSYGLFQLNLLPKALGPLMSSWGYNSTNLLNGFTNIEAAVKLWQRMGKCPWVKPNYCS